MKKILFFAFMLTMSTGAFAASEENTFCTIVVSPCEKVPNTLFKGSPTKEDIAKAQQRMMEECNK
jgi:hypothetical protein